MKLLWVFTMLICYASTRASATNGLLARYRLDVNGSNDFGDTPPFVLTNIAFVHGSAFIPGKYEQNSFRLHYLGTAPIRDLSYEAFTVGLDFCPVPPRHPHGLARFENLLDNLTHGRYARWVGFIDNNTSNILTGGQSYRWVGFNYRNGLLTLTLNNQAFTHSFQGVLVTANQWHTLLCSVDLRQKRIVTLFDGRKLETINLPDKFSLEVIGSPNDAADREFTFVNWSNGSVFRGYAANFKIFGRALTEPELAAVYAEAVVERPTFRPTTASKLPLSLFLLAGMALLILLGVAFRKTNSLRRVVKTSPSG
jgi:hypothetical protein